MYKPRNKYQRSFELLKIKRFIKNFLKNDWIKTDKEFEVVNYWAKTFYKSYQSIGILKDVIIQEKKSKIKIYLETSKPGLLIGTRGIEIDNFVKYFEELFEKKVEVILIEDNYSVNFNYNNRLYFYSNNW